MGLVITPASWLVRRGPEMERYGDRYQDIGYVARMGTTAFIKGWSGGAPTTQEWRQLAAELKLYGITHVSWQRRKDGQVRTVFRRI